MVYIFGHNEQLWTIEICTKMSVFQLFEGYQMGEDRK